MRWLAALLAASILWGCEDTAPVQEQDLVFQPPAFAEGDVIVGTVESVADGDTIEVVPEGETATVRVRFEGVDAPEFDQPWGEQSGDALRDRLEGQTVRLDVVAVDRYDRAVCDVTLGDEDVNLWLVQEGHAWWYRRYAPEDADLEAAENAARAEERGLWSLADEPIAPWDWRNPPQPEEPSES